MARVTHDAVERTGTVTEASGITSERSSRRADAVRNRTSILEAARRLVAEQGTEVAMGEIARAAGVAVGTLYRHFPNKTDLLAAVVNEYVEALADDAQDAWARVEAGRSDAAQELLGFLERALEMISRSHAAKTVARALGAEVEYAEPETRATEALGRLIEEGRASGRLRSDLAVSDLYVLMVFYPGDGSLEVRRRWLELIRPGLLGHGGKDGPRGGPESR
ncbi:TetR/AcrR family transcriptional regulator [Actinomyces naeslundii]|uniref:Transcriptional regulator, TetR family n=3 Tax=Actinomyces naeslundii TaxID=1655 RepID=J3JIA3_ACTNH|nr:TetR/AcrR family transcriptional regulator [Actinomyces naeslundii]EJN83429.1 transcriptional regulator, TetR family [Actinomyces naeslundii str. Howell 279]OMG32324.1 TetR family transcriptional regulator [Actinomyces naeslundii]QQC21127.1 TetR/AcrR family transcriptional regulator [Actinomyces naeslundii]